jgi:hypothetical protein
VAISFLKRQSPPTLLEKSRGDQSCSRICGTAYSSNMSTVWSWILSATYKGPKTLLCSAICWYQAPGCSLSVGLLWPTQSHCARWPQTVTRNTFCSVYSFARAHTHTHTQRNSLRSIIHTQHTFFSGLWQPQCSWTSSLSKFPDHTQTHHTR